MPYFHISNGLRGCYMPDSASIIFARTRRELKSALEDEARHMADSYFGANKRAIAHIAALAWRNRKRSQLPYCLPLAPRHAPGAYSYGIFVSSASRADYREYLAQGDY